MNELQDMLHPLGITPNYHGFHYVVCAVSLVLEDQARLLMVTKDLYPAVAQRHRTTPACVERSIRYVIQIAYESHPDLLAQVTFHPPGSRPCCAQFIACLAGWMGRKSAS